MALTQIPTFELTVTFAAIDEEGVIITRDKTYSIVATGADDAARNTSARANRDLFLADLALATGADIVKHSMREVYADPVVPTSTFNLYRELLITFVLSGGTLKKAPHAVVAPSLDFVAGQNLNLGHADVTAYINNFLATGGIVSISDGEFVADANNVAASRIRQVRSGVSYT